jgi:hypothetical protein
MCISGDDADMDFLQLLMENEDPLAFGKATGDVAIVTLLRDPNFAAECLELGALLCEEGAR